MTPSAMQISIYLLVGIIFQWILDRPARRMGVKWNLGMFCWATFLWWVPLLVAVAVMIVSKFYKPAGEESDGPWGEDS